jgi:hypothetical protein
MGRNATSKCPTCNVEMRSDNLPRHLARGSCAKLKQVQQKKDDQQAAILRVKAILQEALRTGAYATMKHVYFRTDKWVPDKGEQDILALWNVYHQLKCACGVDKDCAGPHSHFVGASSGPSYLPAKQMGQYFTEKNAWNSRPMTHKDMETFEGKAEAVKHFVHTVCYIQTEKGWHTKLGHDNPYTFKHLTDTKLFLAELYGDWMWAQVDYMRYLHKCQDKRQEMLDHIPESDVSKRKRIQDQMDLVEEKLLELEGRWGEEHHYKDEELMADLDEFIKEL